MAEDDYGLKIPVPDEHTRDHDFYALVRDALNRIAALLSAPPAPVDLSPLARRLDALEKAPAPAPVDLSPLARRLDALEKAAEPNPHPDALADIRHNAAALEHRLNALESETP